MYQNNSNAKRSILTQNKLLAVSKMKLHWLFFALLLPILVLIATLSAAPDSEAGYVPIQTVVSDVVLPLHAFQENQNDIFWQTDLVRNKDTLDKLFSRMGVRDDDAIKFLMLSPESSAINTQLIPGRSIQTKTNPDGKLLHLAYELPENETLIADLTSEGYKVKTQKLALERHEIYQSANIISSLFGATDDAGIPDQVALKIADIFSSQIDFNEDLRPGDKFNVVYEAFYNDGERVKIGDVLAVEFINKGEKYQAIHYGTADSKFSYYTPEGKSLHKSFLRSPLEFTRVSSSFTQGRFHPILHRIRAHKGVDLAGKMGTRIKASGDGVVSFMGRKGGYGNVIILTHPGNIRTVYGHLSGFAKGLHIGSKVEQSDIIGYVGMSGLATGPHLHYEFLLNGIHRDPMTVALPTSVPLDNKYRNEFDAQALEYLAKIEMLNRNLIASSN
jgi:murein DD-endopeptidase MepM/ murein hydrolase activator NlpD